MVTYGETSCLEEKEKRKKVSKTTVQMSSYPSGNSIPIPVNGQTCWGLAFTKAQLATM